MSIVVIVLSPAPDAAREAIGRTLESTVGASATVDVRSAGPGETADDVRARVANDPTNLVSIVTWRERDEAVSIQLRRPGEARWSDREIRFEVGDAAAERGRTIGYALASVIPPEATRPPASEPAAEVAPSPMPSSAEPRETSVRPAGARSERFAIDVVGVVASAVDGDGGGVGGAASGYVHLGHGVWLGGLVGARAGEVNRAQASSRVFSFGAGVRWQATLDSERRWTAGARANVLALGQSVVHLSADDPEPDHRFRFLPGLLIAGEASRRFSEQASLVGALGSEIALGKTDIYVRQARVAVLAPFRLVAELGIRVSF